eukprot:1615554-Alexandrium_andersonii.AAC.1
MPPSSRVDSGVRWPRVAPGGTAQHLRGGLYGAGDSAGRAYAGQARWSRDAPCRPARQCAMPAREHGMEERRRPLKFRVRRRRR